jgi:putative ATP-binding cassette transporter
MMIIEIIKNKSKRIWAYSILTFVMAVIDLFILITTVYILGHILPEQPSVGYTIFFVSLVLISFFMSTFNNKKIVRLAETIVSETRMVIIQLIRKCELKSFEKIEKIGAFNVITLDTQIIADSILKALRFFISVSLYIGILTYFFMTSRVAFYFTLSIIVIGGYFYSLFFNQSKKLIHEARQKEKELFRATQDIIEGFKEIKTNDQKSDDLFHQCLKVKSAENRKLRVKSEYLLIESNVFSTLIEFGIFIPIVFILPVYNWISHEELIGCVSLILFIPFGLIKDVIPNFVRSGASTERLFEFEKELNQLKKEENCYLTKTSQSYSEIKFDKVCFYHMDQKGVPIFGIKNLSCAFHPGEIVFMIGGNGSGKSTFLKVLTGLYLPFSGHITINGAPAQIDEQRNLFSAIFTDFHLFDRFYGIQNGIDPKKVNDLLQLMKLDHKVSVQNNQFSTTDLSTGQRKRLAMIIAIMEDKPIYVFDEWAADQSPGFRDYFYYQLLPALKQKGKTVIAVTHDQQYFDIADRILELDYGCLR